MREFTSGKYVDGYYVGIMPDGKKRFFDTEHEYVIAFREEYDRLTNRRFYND